MASLLPFPDSLVSQLHQEYSGLECSVEIVNNLQEVVDLINVHGSAHTDSIVTEDGKYMYTCTRVVINNELVGVAERFLQQVDSACVFHNVSTRFADGYRYVHILQLITAINNNQY